VTLIEGLTEALEENEIDGEVDVVDEVETELVVVDVCVMVLVKVT
jgi:hypothetical protein